MPASSLVPFDPVADPVSVDPAEAGVAGGERGTDGGERKAETVNPKTVVLPVRRSTPCYREQLIFVYPRLTLAKTEKFHNQSRQPIS